MAQTDRLSFDLDQAKLATAWLPVDEKAFRDARKRWVEVVRRSPHLTPSQRHIGKLIADDYLNRQSGHRWFNWGWAAHATLASKTGYSRRTVLAAMNRLEELDLIVVVHGGGKEVPGGRTNLYTLRTDRLQSLGEAASAEQNDVKNYRISPNAARRANVESGEKHREMMRNSQQNDEKTLRSTLSTTLLNDSLNATAKRADMDSQQACQGKKERVTSLDHAELARTVGNGGLQEGFNILQELPEATVDSFALELRKRPQDARALAARVAELRKEIVASKPAVTANNQGTRGSVLPDRP